jgi:L-threonylcarbamoyladenylate synthase
VKIVAPTPSGLKEAASIICEGGVVAYPTETVYGLAVNPFSREAVNRLFAVKGRDYGNAVLLLIGGMEQLTHDIADVTPRDLAYMHSFWPGPLSILLAKSQRLPDEITAGRPKVCVRWTSHPVAAALCVAAGTAITSTSANRSGEPPARSVEELLLPGVDLAVDGGLLPPSAPSTVFDPETGAIPRLGVISEEALRACSSRLSPRR